WLAFTDSTSVGAKVQIDQIQEACRVHSRDVTTLGLTIAARIHLPGSDRPSPGEQPITGTPEEIAQELLNHGAVGVQQVQVELSHGGREGVRAFAKVIRAL